MTRFSWVLVVVGVVGCTGGGDDYPVRPGGGGHGSGTPPPDARLFDAGPGTSGRVCVVDDLRRWDANCAQTGFAGLTVTIGTATATTTADGSFAITAPTGSGLTVRVEGSTIVTSINPYDPTATRIDAVAPTVTAWTDLQAASAIVIATGNGAAMVELLINGSTSIGVVGDSNPAPGAGAGQVFYDNALDKDAWDVDSTDTFGKALFADLPPGAVSLTESYMTASVPGAVEIEPDAITFMSMNLVP